jgi:hypothetical protein
MVLANVVQSNKGVINVTSVDIDGTTEIKIDGGGVSIDGTNDSNLTVTGSNKDLDIAVTGGSTQELRIASAGTGVNAVKINATAGGITLDGASGVIVEGGTTAAAHILFKEGSDNGTNGVKLIGQASTANITVTLPAATDTLVGKATTDTLTNKTLNQDGTGNSITNIANASIKASAAIDATKIANGTVTSAEFQHISTLSSNAQTQISAKAPLASPTFTGVPAAPTISPGTSTTQLATTEFVMDTINLLKSNKADPTFTGACKFPDGSVSAPSITNTGDVNTGILFPSSDQLQIATNGSGRFKVINAGIQVAGTITATGDITGLTSDKRLKKNIKILSNPLDKLKVLSGFTYDWSLDKCSEAGFEPKDEEQIGVFAQDVQSVIPQAVKPAPFDTDSEGNSISGDNYLTVQYEKIVPLLIECIKEQQKQIDELKNKV